MLNFLGEKGTLKGFYNGFIISLSLNNHLYSQRNFMITENLGYSSPRRAMMSFYNVED